MNPGALQDLAPRLSVAGIEACLRLMGHWALLHKEQMALMGLRSRSTLLKWYREGGTVQDWDRLERLSHLLAIHVALRALKDTKPAAYRWIRKPNTILAFGGRPLLAVMLSGGVLDLYTVRCHLEALLPKPPAPLRLLEDVAVAPAHLPLLVELINAFKRELPSPASNSPKGTS